jgi:hypothetical protein
MPIIERITEEEGRGRNGPVKSDSATWHEFYEIFCVPHKG